MRHPEALGRLAIVNGPHPMRLLPQLLNPVQLAKLWYLFFFQLPWLPEWAVRRNGYAMLLGPLEQRHGSAGLSPEERAVYRAAFEQPGALTAMINWYRAMFRPWGAVRLRRIEAEVLVLWGERDPYLGRALAQPSPHWVPRAQVQYFPNAGHFLQQEEPAAVTERLIHFLSAAP